MRRKILNQPVDILDLDEATQIARDAFTNSKQLKIITLNPEMIINALTNLEFQAMINSSHLIVPDGTGIIWAVKHLDPENCKDAKRLPGIELAEHLLQDADKLGKKIVIFGGKEEVLKKVILKFSKTYPNIQIVRAINGYVSPEKYDDVAKDIASCEPDLVLVALGSPKQEIWINKYSSLFPKSIMVGIGGSLDIWSGNKMRAPQWIRDIHLEWLFRVITEPKRLKRVIRSLPVFIYLVLRSKKKLLL